MSINAFVDHGFPPGKEFCVKFISSNEFTIETEIETETDKLKKIKVKHLIKAHCYFGLKPNSTTQDSLQHLKCYSRYYGGSTSVLEFLLKELGL
ncbi:MAG: hypothetical protein ACR9NN_16065 [Nostochopsis sp.]